MSVPTSKRHNALRHAGFSAATILPGESAAEFEKLHQALISEFRPNGALEEETVASLAHLLWRKKNSSHLSPCRAGPAARDRIQEAAISEPNSNPPGSDGALDFDAAFAQKERAAKPRRAKNSKIYTVSLKSAKRRRLLVDERFGGSREIGRHDREMPQAPLANKRSEIFVATVARLFAQTCGHTRVC